MNSLIHKIIVSISKKFFFDMYHNYDILKFNYDRRFAMPLIRPISDLRNRALEISEICHTEEQPIFI